VPVTVARDGHVTTLTVERPPLNILDLKTLAELGDAVQEIAGQQPASTVTVLRGAGERAFSAGVAVEDHTPDKVEAMLRLFHGALEALRDLPGLTLAAVHGHCLGGGMELAAACDFVLAGEGARFGQPEIKLGCFPPYAAALYPSRLGEARTLELLATGRIFGASEAVEIGFATWQAASGEFDSRLAELLRQVTSKSAAVLTLTKRAVRAGATQDFPAALAECERLYNEDLCDTNDMQEGLNAFLEKRRPAWNHR
jgi:cyclohexa-1,5-dienecarbonyl-CoA hydratase